MTTESKPVFKGFNIELPTASIRINVQDIYKNIIAGAEVILSYNGQNSSAFSNINGCVALTMGQGLIYDITIKKQTYKDHHGKVVMISKTTLSNPLSNFVIKVVDSGNIPINAATITLVHDSVSIEGESNSDGVFETVINTGFNYSISINKSGYGSFNSKINSFINFNCENSNNLIISVVYI